MTHYILHKAENRGFADHGWLRANHSFSFAGYYHPERMHFGVLRVLNDDRVAPGMGFGTHPHDNMEIITIPLAGELRHRDSMGNSSLIQAGEIQVMSAGTGVQHSEFNASNDTELNLLQIWLYPNKRQVAPRYDQKVLKVWNEPGILHEVLAPYPSDNAVWIHQDAWFSMGIFPKDAVVDYALKRDTNGIYLFVLEGAVSLLGHDLKSRDAMGIQDTKEIKINVLADHTRMLIMDVPMELPQY